MRRLSCENYVLLVWTLIVVIASSMALADELSFGILCTGVTLVVLFLCLWLANWQIRSGFKRNAIVLTVCSLIIISVIGTHWPLKLNFILVKRSMNQIAANIEKGKKQKTPFMIGTFRITETEVRHGCVCLWTDPDPGGPVGFVKASPTKVQYFNLWSNTKLDNDWQFINED